MLAIAVTSRRGGFVHRWQSVFEFSAEGAHWGLVALDQRVSRAPLLSCIDEAPDKGAVRRFRTQNNPPEMELPELLSVYDARVAAAHS